MMGVSWWLPFYVSQRGLKTRWAGYYKRVEMRYIILLTN
jgi:hypothetical protein